LNPLLRNDQERKKKKKKGDEEENQTDDSLASHYDEFNERERWRGKNVKRRKLL